MLNLQLMVAARPRATRRGGSVIDRAQAREGALRGRIHSDEGDCHLTFAAPTKAFTPFAATFATASEFKRIFQFSRIDF
jgi:hypothetical protein